MESNHEHGTYCDDCGERIAASTGHPAVCLNLGACFAADRLASKLASGETVKARLAPAAWTGSGGVD